MTVTLAQLALGAIDQGEVLETSAKTSAFLTLGKRKTAIPAGGEVISNPVGNKAYGIGESGQKIASGKNEPLKMGRNKIQTSTVFTEEAIAQAENVWDVTTDIFPSAIAQAFDEIALGIVDVPAAWTNFGTFKNAAALPISEGAEASVDFDDARAAVADGVVTGIVLTTSMLQYLKRQRYEATGARVFDISDGMIEGIPYATVASAVKVGVLGNFKHLYASLETFKNPLPPHDSYRIKDAGSITDSDGTVHNLTDSNELAFIAENWAGLTFAAASFAKIVPAPAA
jgi:hypothetical protein